MEWRGWVALILILAACLTSIFRKKTSSDLYFVIAAGLLVSCGIVPAKELIKSMVNEATVAISCLYILSRALYNMGCFHRIFPQTQKFQALLFSGVLGAFFNPVDLLLAAKKKQGPLWILPLGMILTVGGVCILLGSPITLALNTLLNKVAPGSKLNFFEIGKIGLPCLFLSSIYVGIFSKKSSLFISNVIQEASAIIPLGSTWVGKRGDSMGVTALYRCGKPFGKEGAMQEGDLLILEERIDPDQVSELRSLKKPSDFSSGKQIFGLLVYMLMILACAFHIPVFLASMGALLVFLIFRMIKIDQALKFVPTNLLFLITCGFVFAYALENTDLSLNIAKQLHSYIGSNKYVFIGSFFVIASLLSHCIPNVIAACIVFPIALQCLKSPQLETLSFQKMLVIALAVACSLSFLKPKGTPVNVIAYGMGEFSFVDYMKIGIPLVVVTFLICLFFSS